MSLPQSLNVGGKDFAIYTFKQLEQKPRLTLKNLAMNLQDAIGAERLPPLRAAGSVEEVISWIIDVQCTLSGAMGIQLTPRELGVPSDYSMSEGGLLGGGLQAQPQAQAPRAEMPYPEHAAMAEAAQTKARNQRGSNIFGGNDDPSPRGYAQQRQPMQQFAQADPNEAAARAAYEAAMDQAAATRARNQRGSAIFG